METKERDVAQKITQEHSESADLSCGKSSRELQSGSGRDNLPVNIFM